MDSKLKEYLKRYGVSYILHEHEPTFTVEQSRKIKKNIPGMSCKTLFLKDDKDKFYLVGMDANKKLDTKSLRKYLGVKKLYFASEEELNRETGLVPGSVSIFGIINTNKNVKLILTQDVWDSEIVGFHSNINTETLEIEHRDLEKFYDSLDCEKEVVDI